MKRNLIIMIIISFILVGALTFMGFEIKKKNAPYTALEKDLKEAAESYVGQYVFNPDSNLKIELDTLKDKNLIKELKYQNENCKGYVVYSKNYISFEYKPYIKCDNYTTKGYTE